MPRLEPGGPGLVVSPDHAWIAVASNGKLSLIDAASRETRATAELPAGGETDLYASAKHLFAFVRMEAATGCVIYALPSLEPVTSMELIGMATPIGGVQDRVLVVGLNGEMPRILALVGKNLTADPIALREPVLFAAEAPDQSLLVAARDQIECWDPVRRRALFRLHLPVSNPRMGGFASRRRQLWVVTASAAGPLEVYRFSDGRLQARAELGKRVVAVDGHPESPRLVVAARAEGKPAELVQFDLALGERNAVKMEGTAASFCVADGHKPVLVVGRSDGSIDYVALPRATPLDDPRRSQPPPKTEGLSDRLAGWRDRLAGEKPDGMEAARARLADPPRRREESKPARPTPVVRREEAPPLRREAEPPRRDPEPAGAPLVITTGGWRSSLCAWASATLDSPGQAAPPPADEQSTLARAIAHLELGPAAARALSLLYGQWLLGDGEKGVAAATLAQASDDDGDEGGWREALLGGDLGRSRLCRIRGGRVCLRKFAARFLDGRPTRLKLVPAPLDGKAVAIAASHRVSGEPEDPSLLAHKLGRAVALIRSGPKVEAQLAEARLLEVLPVVLGAEDAERWAPLVATQVVVCAFDEDAPLLRELPTLE
jgi:hypothetical protein